MTKTTRRFGWRRDLPDQRDIKYSVPRSVAAALPPKVDLLPVCPPVYDQLTLGSCTGNAIGTAFQFNQIKQDKAKAFIPSRLFVYYNERDMEGTVNEDAGAIIRDGIKCIAKLGVCPEIEWPYVIDKFKVKPPASCYTHALEHQSLQYMSVEQSLDQMKGCLAAGYPFVFGFTVYESFMSNIVAKTGIMSMPAKKEKARGGHAVTAVGYDDATKCFTIRNSWGTKWGKGGNFYMPYAYIVNSGLAADFWTIRLVEV